MNATQNRSIEDVCAEFLYSLRDRFAKEKNSNCERILNELLDKKMRPCEIVNKLEREQCFEKWKCDSTLEGLIDSLKKEGKEECLKEINMLQRQGLNDCLILFVFEQIECNKEKDSCQDAFDDWVKFFEEHRRYDCLQKLLDNIANSGEMTICKAVAYLEGNSDCMEVDAYEKCYEEFVTAYEECIEQYGVVCSSIFSKYPLERGKDSETGQTINYCELISFIIQLPPRPVPPVELPEQPRPGEGGGSTGGGSTPEIDPVVPTYPTIPDPPLISGRIWWYHSDHLSH
ncbi:MULTISPECIES: hypothetical protein [unclassified Myroides]|uniref:hypothetical protein n=1 Tax=unclassified Myroides TaxID=2642485 RepID=UPI003D2F5D8F